MDDFLEDAGYFIKGIVREAFEEIWAEILTYNRNYFINYGGFV